MRAKADEFETAEFEMVTAKLKEKIGVMLDYVNTACNERWMASATVTRKNTWAACEG